MQNDYTNILEYTEAGIWRLILFDIDEDTQAKSVQNIIEYDSLDDMMDFEPIHIDKFGMDIKKDMLPAGAWRQRFLLLNHEARLEYIRDCYQAVSDAEIELANRKAELAHAVNGVFI